MQRLLLGTGNRKKLVEIAAFLAGVPVDAVSVADLRPVPPAPEESGATFEENAALKALAYARAAGLPCLADDSGIEVDALGGRPGVHSARFAGPEATDGDNNARLLRELAGVPAERRGAGYVSVVTIASPAGVLASARGSCRGVILEAPRGTGGFGYDPLFLVPELGRTYAELTTAEKERISHRGQALRRILPELRRLFAPSTT